MLKWRMQFFVYSRTAIEAVAPHEVPHIIISITSHTDDRARIRTTKACHGILRLSFVDADVASAQIATGDLFSTEQALTIWEFVDRHRPVVERILVHCDAGFSRSPAVAAALSRALLGDDSEFFGGRYRPNMLVYRTLLDVRARASTPA